MRHSAALTLLAAPDPLPGAHRAPRHYAGSRGVPSRVLLDIGEALAPCVEAIALTQDVLAAVQRLVMAAMADSPMAVVNEAQKLGHRAVAARQEFRRLAAAIEDPEGGNAA